MIGIAKVFSDIACGCVRVIVCLFLLERLITAQRPQRRCIAAGAAGAAAITVLLSLDWACDRFRSGLVAFCTAWCAYPPHWAGRG